MKKDSVIIADDEPVMAEELRTMVLQSCPDLHIAAVCYDGETALEQIIKLRPDLVFLDIEMPGMTGMTVAQKIQTMENVPAIIFVTAYDHFAVQAFSVDAVDYILKPLEEREISRVLKKYERLHGKKRSWEETGETNGRILREKSRTKKFSVDEGDRMEIIDSGSIRFIYAQNRQVFLITTQGQTCPTRLHLRDFELRLPLHQFFRCHRNYIVNINEVRQIKLSSTHQYVLIMKGDDIVEIPIGRRYAERIKEYVEMS